MSSIDSAIKSVIEYILVMKDTVGEGKRLDAVIGPQVLSLRRTIASSKPNHDEARRALQLLKDSPFSATKREEIVESINDSMKDVAESGDKDGKKQSNRFFYQYLLDTDWTGVTDPSTSMA